MLQQAKINFVIKDQVIRYCMTNQPSLKGVLDYGEQFFANGIVEDGQIIDQDAFQVVLQELVAKKRWENKLLCFCVPDTSVVIRELLAPKGWRKEEIKNWISNESQAHLCLPFANPVIDLAFIGEKKNKSKFLLFAYPKEQIISYIESFSYAGLKPVVADINALSLYRLYHQLTPGQKKEHLLSVQWGRDAVVLTIFHHHRPLLIRKLKLSVSNRFRKTDTEENEGAWTGNEQALEQMIEEELVAIERLIEFYHQFMMQKRQQITKILLTGDFPCQIEIKRLMEKRWGLFIETLANFHDQFDFSPKYADVLGLSLKKSHF